MEKKTDYVPVLKRILFVGDPCVGKSNLVTRLADDRFTDKYISTIGIEFRITHTDDHRFKLQVWDTPSQERLHNFKGSYYRNANVLVYVFSVDSRLTFNSLISLMHLQKQHCQLNIERLLIGNKTDCANREVTIEEAEKWAIDHDMAYLDFSAKNDLKATLLRKVTEVVEKENSINN